MHPPGVVFQKPFSSGETEIAGLDDDAQERRGAGELARVGGGAPALGRRIYQKGLQTFHGRPTTTTATSSATTCSIAAKARPTWRLLKTDLRDTMLVWDTSSAPNGTYVLKVVASDRRSNPADAALGGELESSSFDIDNVPPTVQLGAIRRDGTRFVVPSTFAMPTRR